MNEIKCHKTITARATHPSLIADSASSNEALGQKSGFLKWIEIRPFSSKNTRNTHLNRPTGVLHPT